jgi:hypothetical protein
LETANFLAEWLLGFGSHYSFELFSLGHPEFHKVAYTSENVIKVQIQITRMKPKEINGDVG